MADFTHINEQGRARMVDISGKERTNRTAVAFSRVRMREDAWEDVKAGRMRKGDVLAVAQVAGIMAAKKTADLIPMCHPLSLTGVDIRFEFPEPGVIDLFATVKTTGSTGVEMEALTAASVTALTIYDMCKALDKAIEIGPTRLLEKTGGKSGTYRRGEGENDADADSR